MKAIQDSGCRIHDPRSTTQDGRSRMRHFPLCLHPLRLGDSAPPPAPSNSPPPGSADLSLLRRGEMERRTWLEDVRAAGEEFLARNAVATMRDKGLRGDCYGRCGRNASRPPPPVLCDSATLRYAFVRTDPSPSARTNHRCKGRGEPSRRCLACLTGGVGGSWLSTLFSASDLRMRVVDPTCRISLSTHPRPLPSREGRRPCATPSNPLSLQTPAGGLQETRVGWRLEAAESPRPPLCQTGMSGPQEQCAWWRVPSLPPFPALPPLTAQTLVNRGRERLNGLLRGLLRIVCVAVFNFVIVDVVRLGVLL
jgi:hypothetical protein